MPDLAPVASFLEHIADRMERWANDSVQGGWSTHQVQANRQAAFECRSEAFRLRCMKGER